MQVVVLIGELDGGGVEHDALLHAVALGEGTSGDVADDDLQGDDGHLLHHGLPLAQLLHKVGGHAGLLQLAHQVVGHLVVDGPLAGDGALFQTVKGGGGILVGHDDQTRVLGGIDLLGLALIQLLDFLHSRPSFLFLKNLVDREAETCLR